MSEKLCWFCSHFWYSQATPDYSEYTPGSSFSINCEKRHWDFDAYETSQEQFGQMLSTAATCKDFDDVRGAE